jgi:hypothetical protein
VRVQHQLGHLARRRQELEAEIQGASV